MNGHKHRTYLITGATGTVGSDLVAKLVQADPVHEIRCATRDPRGAAAEKIQKLGSNVRPVTFDATQPETLAASFAGATHVYLLPPFVEQMVRWHEEVLAAAQEAGTVQYLIKHSVMGAREPTTESMPNPVPLMHYGGEKAVVASGIPYSIIRPTIFAQHFTGSPWIYEAGADAFYLPIGSARVAFLDARDIATLAVHLLTQAEPQSYHRRVFELTGPAAVSGPEIAQALSQAAGRQIRYVDPPEDRFMERITSSRVDAFSARQLRTVYHDCKEGWLGKYIAQDFAAELNRPTTTFAQFALDHAEHFRKRVVRR